MSTTAPTGRLPRYAPALIMGLGGFIATFDITAVSLALPDISQQFSLEIAGYVWIMNGYSLALTVMLIAAGAISDRYGHRLSVIIGAGLFLAASLLCAFAGVYGMLVIGRVLQGASAAFIVCGGLALVGRTYSDKSDRVKAFGIIGTIQGSALAIGPGLGGIITSSLGWEWIFLINVPICLAIIFGCVFGTSEDKARDGRPLDVYGVLVFSVVLLMSSWLLLQGPEVAGATVNTPVAVTVLAVLVAVFVMIERRTPHPVVDPELFRSKTFIGFGIVPLCLAISYWSLIVYIPMFFQSSLDLGTDSTAYLMLFFTAPMFLVPYLVTGIAKKARQSVFYFGGLGWVAAGCMVIAVGAYLGSLLAAAAGMVVAGVGAAAIQNQVTGALIASAPEDRAGAVSALMTVLRQGGFAVGSALLSNTLVVEIGLGAAGGDGFTALFLTCALVAGVGSLAAFTLIRSDEREIVRKG